VYIVNLKLVESALVNKRPIEIVYQDEKGVLTQRIVRVRNIVADLVVAFCYCRRENRTFKLDGILSAQYALPNNNSIRTKKERRAIAL
jgi:predicted DNA-binding transcriptional regulator YafY